MYTNAMSTAFKLIVKLEDRPHQIVTFSLKV